MTTSQKFAIRYGSLRLLLIVLGMGQRRSGVELDGTEMKVRMGWAFQADIARTAITGARPVTGMVGGIGVHGWRGRWLVNGTTTGIVGIDLEPPARARAVGLPVRMHYLALSLEDPDAFVAAVTG